MNWRNLFEERNKLFWVLQTAGWTGYALIQYIGTLMQELRDIYLVILLLGAYAGFLLTIPLRYLYQRIWHFPPWLLAILVVFTSYLVAVVWAIIDNTTHWEIYQFGYRPYNYWMYLQHSVAKFYIILTWSGLYFGIKYYQLLQDERQKALTAVSMAHQSQLKMLRYQLNPHFLFNTLNAISTLILVGDNKDANRMVSKLSEFLRFSLDNEPIKRITLARELEALMLYLEIEKVRFAERLDVQVSVSEQARDALVPSLLLQPLIENAIKYAIAPQEGQGIIRITGTLQGADLHLCITDNGPAQLISQELAAAGRGVGLKNTRERLKALYGKNFSFTLSANHPTGCRVDIRIPWQRAEE